MFGRMMVEPVVQLGPGVDLQTGVAAIYVVDRMHGTWYSVDFENQQFGGYSVGQLEELLKDCKFLDLIERPGLQGGLWRP